MYGFELRALGIIEVGFIRQVATYVTMFGSQK